MKLGNKKMSQYLSEEEKIKIVENELKTYLESEILGNDAETITPIRCRTELTYTECNTLVVDKMKNNFEISRDIIDSDNVKMPIIIYYEKMYPEEKTAILIRVVTFWGDIQFK